MSAAAHSSVEHAAGHAVEHGGGHSGGLDFSEILAHHLVDHPMFHVGGFALTKLMVMILIAAGLATLLVLLAASTRGRLRTAMEAFVLLIRGDIVAPALGPDTGRYLPYFLTLFIFILLMNLLGLVPGGATATGNLTVTMTLSMLTFFLIQASGIWRHGFCKHFKNLIPHGVPWWAVPGVFVIEFMGYFTKCIALTIRLFANMTAGHMVILLFLGLILLAGQAGVGAGFAIAPFSVGLVLALYGLEIIVGLVQAYVFTLLTAIFVGIALHPEH